MAILNLGLNESTESSANCKHACMHARMHARTYARTQACTHAQTYDTERNLSFAKLREVYLFLAQLTSPAKLDTHKHAHHEGQSVGEVLLFSLESGILTIKTLRNNTCQQFRSSDASS